MEMGKITDPIQNVFDGIKKILDSIIIKDKKSADQAETETSKNLADMWIRAKMEEDTYLTYAKFWDISMFQEVVPNVKYVDCYRWMNNPYTVPYQFHDNLRRAGREAFLRQYVEENDYYRTLNGLPKLDDKDFIYLSEPVRNQLHATDVPVHELSELIQNNYMNTDEYHEMVKRYPEKEYLNYLGSNKIDLFVARRANDFEIIRYPLNRSDISPNLLTVFAKLYEDYREYVMITLYNEYMEDLYVGYRAYMGLIIKIHTILQIGNSCVEAINNRRYLDDSILHIILSMYKISSDLLMTQADRRNLAIHLLRITQDKGTSDVYEELVDILNYQDIAISKLMLIKGQQFDPSNNYKALDKFKPYFAKIPIDTTDMYSIINDPNTVNYSYEEITNPDPTWWDTDDTREILNNREYSIADTKYIMVESAVHQMRYMMESIYFTHLILDNKYATDQFMVEIPELFGGESVSVFDLIIFCITATCMNYGYTGKIKSPGDKLLAVAGFNFDLDFDSFIAFVNGCEYLDKERVMSFLSNLTMRDKTDIYRLFNDVIEPMQEWLELKIARSDNRKEYLEYEAVYRALYSYDINKNQFIEDFKMPIDVICENYGISFNDMQAYQYFYPRTMTGKAITVDEFQSSRYPYPFIDHNHVVDWYLHIVIESPRGDEDRGIVYLHDILNSDNCMELTNPDGTRIFMDYNDGEIGWEVNHAAVYKAIELIDSFSDHMLDTAFFAVDTPIPNSQGRYFEQGKKLPAIIRTSIFKDILKDKINMDADGLSAPPETYADYLFRKNKKLYELLFKDNRFTNNHTAWANDIMTVVLALEANLNLHLKYFEQSIIGSDLFFKPLITLIKRFKSNSVDFVKTNLKYIFDDKMDAGGSSNMLKLFDEIKFVIHFVTLYDSDYSSTLGLFDAIHYLKYLTRMYDNLSLSDEILVKKEQVGA